MYTHHTSAVGLSYTAVATGQAGENATKSKKMLSCDHRSIIKYRISLAPDGTRKGKYYAFEVTRSDIDFCYTPE